MSADPTWLPELVRYEGDWGAFVDTVYRWFCDDLVTRKVFYRGLVVAVRYHPPSQGKGFGFWHCVSEGLVEENRTPDLERCRRIGWIRAIIENAGWPGIDEWSNQRRGENCRLLWWREEYLIVLAQRVRKQDGKRYWLLKTAYCTDREFTKTKLRRERDAAGKRPTPPP